MSINTNHVYAAFNEQIDRSRAWLGTKVRDACNFEGPVLADRLAQRLVEIGLAPYATMVRERLKSTTEFAPPPETPLDCGPAVLHTGSGRITVPSGRLLAAELGFLGHWTYWLMAIISGAFSRNETQGASLVLDLTDENVFTDGTDHRFVDYCRFGPIAALRDGTRFLIKSSARKISSDPGVYAYVTRPLITLVRDARLGFLGRARLLLLHLLLFLQYHRAVLMVPQLSLIAKELACSSISFYLDSRALIHSIILTCSSAGCQPLWIRSLRRASVHMIWYSQNWKPLSYLPDGLSSDWPALRWIRVNTHWVWTKSFAQYLVRLGLRNATIEVVGPIVWTLPQTEQRDDSTLKLLVFDVPAVSDKVMVEIVGEISNYYHPDNLLKFVSDIVALKVPLEKAFKVPVSVCMKMKRGMRPHYAAEYFHQIEDLYRDGLLLRAEPDANLYSLISSSHLVIAYPFTSPAYLAASLGVPCIYYDPTQTAMREFFDSYSSVSFARGFRELLAEALQLLGAHRAQRGLSESRRTSSDDRVSA